MKKYYLVLLSFLLLQCGGNEQPYAKQEDKTPQSLLLILGGESVNTTEISIEKSQLIDGFSHRLLEGIELRVRAEEKLTPFGHMLPYSWLPLRFFLEDLKQFEYYSKAPVKNIGAKPKRSVLPPSWKEMDMESARYPLVRRKLIDSEGETQTWGPDSVYYFNSYYQELKVIPDMKTSKYSSFSQLYNTIIVENMQESFFLLRQSDSWKKEVVSIHGYLSKCLLDSLFVSINEGELPDHIEKLEFLNEWELRDEIRKTLDDKGYFLTEAFDQLSAVPLSSEMLEQVKILHQITSESGAEMNKEVNKLQLAYDSTATLLEKQEQALFQQLFVHCKTVEQSQEHLLKRLVPFQDEEESRISILSLLDVLNAIESSLQAYPENSYSEIESILYEIKKDYFQRVRKAEVAFLRR